jgi:hypothetical protein
MTIRKTFAATITGLGIAAMLAVTPASAGWHGGRGWGGGALAAGVIGGMALGAMAASAARPAYAYEPAYAPAYAPAYVPYDGYEPVCYRAWRPVYRSDGTYLRDKLVRVCE